MVDFDANGIYVNAYGEKTYKRIAHFMLDGKKTLGGIYIGQSTDDELMVDVYELGTKVVDPNGTVTETYNPTGRLINISMEVVLRIDEPPRTPDWM